MSVVDKLKDRLERFRERRPVVDHLVCAIGHYGDVRGNALAAAITYFAFLSFFPILALAFAIFGQVSKIYEGADAALVKAAEQVLPGLIGPPDGIELETLQGAAPGIFSIGIVLTLYSGLGWLSGMRDALLTVFEEPPKERPSFVAGKLRDVVALLSLGTILILSVAVSGVATKVLDPLLELLGLEAVSTLTAGALVLVLGFAANVVLYYAFFRLLATPNDPTASLWSGALLGAIAFEVLKQLSTYLLSITKDSEAFQAFGIALILLVWISYFSRVVVFSAAWAHTTADARARREARREARAAATPAVTGSAAVGSPRVAPPGSSPVSRPVSPPVSSSRPFPVRDPRAAFATGAAAMLALVAAVRRRRP